MIFGKSKKYRLCSGLFVLLKLKVKVGLEDVGKIAEHALSSFPQLALSPVPTCMFLLEDHMEPGWGTPSSSWSPREGSIPSPEKLEQLSGHTARILQDRAPGGGYAKGET